MLVQVLSRADAEEEPTVEHHRGRRRRLRDDRRMDADDRTGDAGADRQLCRRRDRADHRPDKWALALSVDPRMEVIRELDVGESGLLGALRRSHHLERAVLLARNPKADLHRLACCTERAAGRPWGAQSCAGPNADRESVR